jgi:hypothetical protein
MHLEVMLGGGETLAGPTQVQYYLLNLIMKLQDMENNKVVHANV